MKLFSLTRYQRRSRHWQFLSMSLTRLTRTSLLHRDSYSDGTLYWDLLYSNMCNVWFVKVVWRCKEITRLLLTMKGPSVLPVSLENFIVDTIKYIQSGIILWSSKISRRIIFFLEIWCLHITISHGLQVAYNTQRASHIHLRCSQAGVFLLTTPLLMWASSTKWI